MLLRRHWDLRGKVDTYLGHVDFAGRRVLEIGPASGFLTKEMEARGASVVCVELQDDPGWDFVPYPAALLKELTRGRAEAMRRMKNSFWCTHHAFNLKASMYYGDVYRLPDELGDFDIAVMAAVLLHTKNPHNVVAECAKRARTLILVEVYAETLESCGPIMRLYPDATNGQFDTWWHFSTDFFRQYLDVLGFDVVRSEVHWQRSPAFGRDGQFFTIVARHRKA